MRTPRNSQRIVLAIAFLALAVTPAFAADLNVESGLDIWITRGDGSTFFSFAEDPLPADFFCSGSEPFTGKIVFKGVPVATYPQNALGGSDTILQRIDHAVFDKNGVAVTRLQIRALHFEGVELLQTLCGDYRAEVMLDGEQPVTEMRIFKESPQGGVFEAEVAVNAKLVFTPVGHHGEVLESGRSVVFPPRPNSFWASQPGEKGIHYKSFVVVDTNSDGMPDTFVPGTSRNFAAGWPATPREAALLRNPAPIGSAGGPFDNKLVIGCADNCHCDPECGNHCMCPPGQFCENF